MRVIRRTVRTAAVTTGVIAAFAVPVTAAVAAPGAAGHDAAQASAGSGSGSVSVAASASSTKGHVRVTMPDGRVATLAQGGAQGPRAEIAMPNGTFLGRLDAQHPSALNDGWTYKLVRDGRTDKFVVIDGRGGGCSWVYDFRGRLVEKYSVDRTASTQASTYKTKTNAATPLGSVQAGMEQDARPVSAPLVAAGGGIAAAGAAGLGFAVLRGRGGRTAA
ncbi:hypothetical protein H9Y04_17770 [Streptomyces sp. TRM66268-LWL]|uniref:Uncharacterized protein n=1 Tax=Streptomyces polyasparticus TaxID=2767826 RepID=A0ABR7SFZ8_9ACTN|nr:hypothetical protein [Streptomyces polyasparticus]MBC9714410.1 hypothetical protein [Streptomyces polyasparticus]